MRPRLLVVGPLPPPLHGVTVSTTLVLRNRHLLDAFRIEHVDTSDHRSGANIGTWDASNVLGAGAAIVRLARGCRGERGVLYFPISQSAPGFLRDSLLALVGHAMGWRVVGHLRGSEFREFERSAHPILRHWIRLTLRRLDGVAVMGESLRWVFEGLVAADRVAVVPNGTPDPGVGGTRDPRHVLFLSNLRRRKGVFEAVETARRVIDRLPSVRFTFAGAWESPKVEREIRALAADAGDRITFAGRVEGAAKDALLASAGVLLFPPVEPEGHPRVVLEAIAAGVPVVATDRGAVRETIVDGVTGFVLPEPDPARLADALVSLLDEPGRLARFSAAARESYLAGFTQDIADRVLADWIHRVWRSSPVAHGSEGAR